MRHPALLALSLAAVPAGPAAGQIAEPHRYPPVGIADPFLPDSRLPGPGVWRDTEYLHDRIDRAREAGLITRREARRLNREVSRIRASGYRYERDGLSRSEQAELQARTQAVSAAISRTSGGGG